MLPTVDAYPLKIYTITSPTGNTAFWKGFLVSYIEERPLQPNPQKRKKEERERLRGEREIRSSILILDLNDGKL